MKRTTADLFTHDQYVGDKLDYVVHIPKQKADGDKISWILLKIQNLQLVCKMDRQFILSNE
jgi:hypothetical protein